VEIYEGDIVKYKDYSNGAVLSWKGEDKQPSRFTDIKLQNILCGFRSYGRGMFEADDVLEVMGNIYENPELLGKLDK
jgi:hypothetical protein